MSIPQSGTICAVAYRPCLERRVACVGRNTLAMTMIWGIHMVIQPYRLLDRTRALLVLGIATVAIIGLSGEPALTDSQTTPMTSGDASGDAKSSSDLIAEGQRIFRFDTFGDEQLWTDKLRLHEVVEKSVDPTTAL